MMRVHDVQVATFDDVSLAVLGARSEQVVHEFVARVLGQLASADAELRETVRVYIRRTYSTSPRAEELSAHRNTVVNRIHHAEKLLSRPLADYGLEVGIALELYRWLT
ncbi:helix-turn-helix domain-containing protein [Streptomyces chiangmaiensis]